MRWMPMTCALAFACTPHIRGPCRWSRHGRCLGSWCRPTLPHPMCTCKPPCVRDRALTPSGQKGWLTWSQAPWSKGEPERAHPSRCVRRCSSRAMPSSTGRKGAADVPTSMPSIKPRRASPSSTSVRPILEAATVSRLREEAAYGLSTGAADDEEHLAAQSDLALFEGHPYAHPVQGRHGVVSTLDEGDVRAFYDAHFVRRSVVLGIAGAASDQQVERFVEAAYGLGDGLPPDSARLAPVPVSGRSLWVVETDSDVVGYRFGHLLDVPRSHQDYPALYLAMTAFGCIARALGCCSAACAVRETNYGTYAYAEAFRERSGAAMQEQGVARNHSFFQLDSAYVAPECPVCAQARVWELDQLGKMASEKSASRTPKPTCAVRYRCWPGTKVAVWRMRWKRRLSACPTRWWGLRRPWSRSRWLRSTRHCAVTCVPRISTSSPWAGRPRSSSMRCSPGAHPDGLRRRECARGAGGHRRGRGRVFAWSGPSARAGRALRRRVEVGPGGHLSFRCVGRP